MSMVVTADFYSVIRERINECIARDSRFHDQDDQLLAVRLRQYEADLNLLAAVEGAMPAGQSRTVNVWHGRLLVLASNSLRARYDGDQ